MTAISRRWRNATLVEVFCRAAGKDVVQRQRVAAASTAAATAAGCGRDEYRKLYGLDVRPTLATWKRG